MAAGRRPTWILGSLSLLFGIAFISCDSIKSYGVMNKNVTLSPPHGNNFKEITWKKQKDKVIEWYDSKTVTFEPFINRAHLHIASGNLTISYLTSSDEDEYEFVSSDGNRTAMFSLTVLDPLPHPILICSSNDENITVECTTPGYYSRHVNLLNYSWSCSSEKCKHEVKSKIIFEKEDDPSQEVNCTVNNPVTSMKSSITLSTCWRPAADNSRHRWCIIPPLIFFTCIVCLLYKVGLLRKPDRTNSS